MYYSQTSGAYCFLLFFPVLFTLIAGIISQSIGDEVPLPFTISPQLLVSQQQDAIKEGGVFQLFPYAFEANVSAETRDFVENDPVLGSWLGEKYEVRTTFFFFFFFCVLTLFV